MKHFSILEPTSQEFIEFRAKQLGSKLEKVTHHPQEDYFLISDKYPIFVVADGVTLEPENREDYPDPSGAGDVARIFCEEIIKQGELVFSDFSEENLITIFQKANEEVGKYNQFHGRTKETINFFDFDRFSATGAFAIIKNNSVYWSSICDSYVVHFNEDGEDKFKSPYEENLPKSFTKTVSSIRDTREKTIVTRKNYRNKIENGELIGYGVITGEETAVNYLNTGTLALGKNDLIALCTDGFENYLELPEFISLFKEWPDDLKEKVQQFSSKKSKERPDKYGHERSLIMIRF